MTDTTTLVAEARKAMEGITQEPWATHEGSIWHASETFVRVAHGDLNYFGGQDIRDAHFIAWAGNGGVRRLTDALEAAEKRIEELEGRDVR